MQCDDTEPLFRSVGQALFSAFAMEITPPTCKGATQILIEDLMRRRYGDPPMPQSERSINMIGLNYIERRGQCAMIRQAVKDHLPESECAAIYARFGHQVTRAVGVRTLCEYCAPSCTTQNRQAIMALIWAIYVPGLRQHPGETAQAWNVRRKRRESEWSLRSIERSYGAPRSTLHDDKQRLRARCHALELLGQNRLEELFVRTGLIYDPAYA